MTFNPQYFFDLATILIKDPNPNYNEEARYRTVISRVYYAAHLISKEKLQEIGVKFPIEEDETAGIIHELVINAWEPINENIFDMLKSLRTNRNKADYNLKWQFKKYGVGLLMDQAKIVIDVANQLKKQSNK